MHDFIGQRCSFILGELRLCGERVLQHVVESMKGCKIATVAGPKIEDLQGNLLPWVRTPGEVYRLEVEVPPGVEGMRVFLHYIADQPTTTSYGHDCFSGSSIGVIGPGTVLLYPEAADIDVDFRHVAAGLGQQLDLFVSH